MSYKLDRTTINSKEHVEAVIRRMKRLNESVADFSEVQSITSGAVKSFIKKLKENDMTAINLQDNVANMFVEVSNRLDEKAGIENSLRVHNEQS